jgi:hypothetical protein
MVVLGIETYALVIAMPATSTLAAMTAHSAAKRIW